jgi:hypothetical protein
MQRMWTCLAVAGALAGCNEADRRPSPIEATPATAAIGPTAVNPAAAATRPEVMIIPKRHAIPPGRAADVRRLFSSGAMSYPISVVSAGGAQTQFVQPKPVFIGSDSFVVDIPPEFHDELDHLLDGMAKAPPAVSSAYDVTYWVVEADSSPTTEVPPELAEVATTLEAVTGLGKRRFKSIDRVAAHTLDGNRAEIKGRVIELGQTLTADPDGLRLQLEMHLQNTWSDNPGHGPTLETDVQLKPDLPIVLGDSTLSSASEGAANLLLYVVRARRVD